MARLGLRRSKSRVAESGVTLSYPPLEGEGRRPEGASGWGDPITRTITGSFAARNFTPPRPCGPTLPLQGRVKEESPMPKVLISDALSAAAVQIFKDRGIEVDFQPALGKDKEQACRDHRKL